MLDLEVRITSLFLWLFGRRSSDPGAGTGVYNIGAGLDGGSG